MKHKQRERIKAQPFPAEFAGIIERNVPYFNYLTPDEKAELKGHVLVFLDEKRFEGQGGLTITDEIRVTIAAQACMLLLHRETDYVHQTTTAAVEIFSGEGDAWNLFEAAEVPPMALHVFNLPDRSIESSKTSLGDNRFPFDRRGENRCHLRMTAVVFVRAWGD